MKFKKPKFWDYEKPNISAYLLWPISFIIKLVNYLIAKIKNKKKYSSIKNICVGNIYLGNGKRLLSSSCGVCIELFVSIRPLCSASIMACRSSSERNGGLTLKKVL